MLEDSAGQLFLSILVDRIIDPNYILNMESTEDFKKVSLLLLSPLNIKQVYLSPPSRTHGAYPLI